ncbi:MAG TPA: ScaI family restriction endonuclease [Pyrinomonadaceae bacterium]|nr:ScaI family restriction endonuclease [Pyrinomonadaceae bacterium]
MASPYEGKAVAAWARVTRRLVRAHPLQTAEIVDVVLAAWESIFGFKIGAKFEIGRDIFPKPQIMGFFLHELIPLEFTALYPDVWRGEQVGSDKDIVYIPEDRYSIEVKTSSNPRHIFGNRSYAQGSTKSKKSKSGYYLAVNFEKFSKTNKKPRILLIRFGWLDSSDWRGQVAVTGQQASLTKEADSEKLLKIYSVEPK